MKIKVKKFSDKTRLPERKHYNDTGADLFMPEAGIVRHGEIAVVPLYLGIDLPDGFNAHIQTRTSMAKRGIFIQQCAIDAGYKGDIHMIICNLSQHDFEWEAGERLGYLVITPTIYADFVEDLGDERGDGAFGSTGR